MKDLLEIGVQKHPEQFKYEAVYRKGKPEHTGDYFSIRHPKMDCGRRAKIFAPFAALKGFDEEVRSKEERYVDKRILDADELYDLNDQLKQLHQLTRNGREAKRNMVHAEIEYYVECQDKHSEFYHWKGQYRKVRAVVWKVDSERQLLKAGEQEIPFDVIASIRICR